MVAEVMQELNQLFVVDLLQLLLGFWLRLVGWDAFVAVQAPANTPPTYHKLLSVYGF